MEWFQSVNFGFLAGYDPLLANTSKPGFRFQSFDEAERLLDVFGGEPLWHMFILVTMHTGLRHGEMRALE